MSNLKYKHTAYTSAQWASLNPVIVENEIVIESDTKRTKIGNGISTYNELEYADANSVGNSLGSIKPTDAAPTPARNGNYTFSIGGAKPAWLTAEAGVTTVKAGDGVAVVFTDPSSYTYTHVDVQLADYLESIEFDRKISSNLINPNLMTPGGYKTNGGSFVSSPVYQYSDYIPVVAGQTYTGLINRATPVGVNMFRFTCYYNVNKVVVAGGASSVVTGFTVPAGVSFVVISTYIDFPPITVGLFLGLAPVWENYYDPKSFAKLRDGSGDSGNSIMTIDKYNELDKGSDVEVVVTNQNDLAFTFTNGQKATAKMKAGSSNNTFRFQNVNFKDIVNLGIGDDIAPAHIMNATHGANHGQPCYNATVGAHGLTLASVGSEWTISGLTFYLVDIISSTVLQFLSAPTGDRLNYSFTNILPTGIITRTSNSLTLTISSVVGSQLYQGTRTGVIANLNNQSVKLYQNGTTEISENGTYVGKFFDVVERYSFANYYDILQNLIAGVGSVTPDYTGADMLTFETIYRFTSNGSILVIENLVTNQQLRFQDFMFSQAINIGNNTTKYYVPNSLPISGYDFRAPLAVAWSNSIPALYFGTAYWKDVNNAPNRVIQYYNNTGFAIGFIPIGVGKSLKNYTSCSFEIRNNTGKIYPHGVDDGKMGNTLQQNKVFNAGIYRCYFDLGLTKSGNRMGFYYYEYNGSTYLYVDYSDSMFDRIILDDAFNGKNIEVIESVNTICQSDVYNGGININADYIANDTCYIVLKINNII